MRPVRFSPTAQYNREFPERVRLAPWVTTVYLVPEPEPCARCTNMAGAYEVGCLPATPIKGCRNQRGCECWFVALHPAAAEQVAFSADAPPYREPAHPEVMKS